MTDLKAFGLKLDWQEKVKTTKDKRLIREFNRKVNK